MANVVVVIADDLRADVAHRFMGYTYGPLRAMGTMFTSHRCSVPICSPSRAALASGRYAFRPENGVYKNNFDDINFPNTHALPFWLQGAPGSVETAFSGKYTIPNIEDPQYGFQYWRCLATLEQDPYLWTAYNEDGDPIAPMVPPMHSIDYVFAVALEQISAMTQPWFSWIAPSNPHVNDTTFLNSPLPDTVNRFSWVNWDFDLLTDAEMTGKPTWIQALTEKSPADLAFLQRNIRTQIGEVRDLDRKMEQLAATLDFDTTTLIFTSDSGVHYAEHRLGTFYPSGKGTPYECSMRAPLLIVGPGFEAGATVSEATTLQDITATVCAIQGATPTVAVDGLDLRDPIPAGRATLYEHTDAVAALPPGAGVATGTRKFVRWTGEADPDQFELYDLEDDPGEKTNLAYDPDWADERDELEDALDTILAS